MNSKERLNTFSISNCKTILSILPLSEETDMSDTFQESHVLSMLKDFRCANLNLIIYIPM